MGNGVDDDPGKRAARPSTTGNQFRKNGTNMIATSVCMTIGVRERGMICLTWPAGLKRL